MFRLTRYLLTTVAVLGLALASVQAPAVHVADGPVPPPAPLAVPSSPLNV